MKTARVSKIRPVSWKIFVQGEAEAEYVRGLLFESRIHSTMPEREPGLSEPAVWSFIATAAGDSPLTTEEIEAVLTADEKIELAFPVA